MKKKKWLMAGSAIGISGAVMLATGLTALAGTSGYEDYKSALKATQTLKSVSVQADAALQDNGVTLNETHGVFKVNLPNDTMSGDVKVSGKSGTHSASLYSGVNGEVWNADGSDTYYVRQDGQDEQNGQDKEEKDAGANGDTAWMNGQTENVVDALVGNLKNEVQVSRQSDGSKQISLQLESAQIPAVVQAFAPLAFKKLSEEDGHRDQLDSGNVQQDPEQLFRQSFSDLKKVSLTQDIQMQSISMNADIDASNKISRQQAAVTFTGKDAAGAFHTVQVQVDVRLSDFDQTTPDSIDLTGKKVQQIQDDHQGKHHGDSND